MLGLGLMGGSLVRSLSAKGRSVRCWSPDAEERAAAEELGHVHPVETPEDLARGCDGIVVATPLSAVRGLLARLAAAEPESEAWIQDVASLQVPPLDWALESGLAHRFVSAHPMAGGEASGFAASRPDLYHGAPVHLSARGATAGARAGVTAFWNSLHALPVWTEPEEHDRRMGWLSHLPQVLATHLASALQDAGVDYRELGPGGRDMVRLAGSSPVMWRDVLGHAPHPVARGLREVARRLEEEADRLSDGDAQHFAETLGRTRDWRAE